MKRLLAKGIAASLLLLVSTGIGAAETPVTAADYRDCAKTRAEEIRSTPNSTLPSGVAAYYVSARNGNDASDGRSPTTAWRTSERLGEEGTLPAGSWVLFERGGVYRGALSASPGCTYTAYGEGPKPCICGSPEDGAVPDKWTKTDNPKVWAYPIGHQDVGTLVFNGGEAHAIKVVYRTDKTTGKKTNLATGKTFESYRDLDADLNFWHDYYENGTGCVYLYSDENPGRRFRSIEFNVRNYGISIGGDDVTVDNLCIKYFGAHGVGAGTCRGLRVVNCEFAWIGGSIQAENLFNRDYPTRFGNAVEIYGGCDGYSVVNCFIRQVYDAGMTIQVNSDERLDQKNVLFRSNVVENCNYSIEYFLTPYNVQDIPNTMENVLFADNIMLDAGIGFCEQRPDRNVSAHIRSGGAIVGNRAKNFVIRNNAMIGAQDMLVQIGSLLKNRDGQSSLPILEGNVFSGLASRDFGLISDTSNDRLAYGPGAQMLVDAFGEGNRCLFEFEDDFVAASEAPSRRIVLPDRIVYVFTSTAGAVNVTAKDALAVQRSLVVAGGGGGGFNGPAGGGGGGGVVYETTPHVLAAGETLTLRVGAGGKGRFDGSEDASVSQGGNSVLSYGGKTWTAIGGGFGGGWGNVTAAGGGSGGGNAMNKLPGDGTEGQGNAGASGRGTSPGGGGGAGEPGHRYDEALGGVGGEGRTIDITGVGEVYGSGGGSGCNGANTPAGRGGTNAGDGGVSYASGFGWAGVDGFGGGGGGGRPCGGNGGSGTVVLSIVTGFSYEDDNVIASDDSFSRVFTADGLAYVFRSAGASANFQTKMPMTLTRRLIVAGGGGGGGAIGGGGGGGGVIVDESELGLAAGDTVAVAVGAGGSGGSQGGDSTLTINGVTQMAVGGGCGGSWGVQADAGSGGSGGGQSMYPAHGGSGIAGQGFDGGGAASGSGGGGGAAGPGRKGTVASPGHGGEGVTNDITGVACVYGSGGGGGFGSNNNNPAGKGGTNAGDGGVAKGIDGGNAVDGFGGGGGGAGHVASGGKGGDGVVAFVLRQPSKGLVYAVNLGGLAMNVPDGGAFLADGEKMDFALLPKTNEYGMVIMAVGYTLETRDGETGEWSSPLACEGEVYSHVQHGTDTTRITWQWRTKPVPAGFQDKFVETSAADVKCQVLANANGEEERVYTFVGPGRCGVVLKQPMTLMRSLIVAGGGGGGGAIGGGGGGGGVVADSTPYEFAAGDTVLLTVGAGGSGGSQGGDSTLTINGATQMAVGGGCGGSWGVQADAGSGGSGGGQSMYPVHGGSGVAGQGFDGGGADSGSGGGGGATGPGRKGTVASSGHGGEGVTNDITGVACVYGSGGGGGFGSNNNNPAGKGGTNAGDGGKVSGTCGSDARDGFGGGGGGAGQVAPGGKGGDGTVVLRFATHRRASGFVVSLQSRAVTPISPEGPRVVLCWGDSITEGMGMPTGSSYPARLQQLLGSDYTVLNSGDGGEDAVTICARQGGISLLTTKEFSFAEGQGRIMIGDAQDSGIATPEGLPLRVTQALGRQVPVNELTIGGGRYRLLLEDFRWNTPVSPISCQVWLERLEGAEPRTLVAGTPVVPASAGAAKDAYCQVILMGANGGWNNRIQDLIALCRQMVDRYDARGGYLVVVPYWYGITPEQEQTFRRAFGDHSVLFREEAIFRGLDEEGLTPTEQDRNEMALGRVPPSLLYQNKVDVHLNEQGYEFLAKLIFEQGRKLEYW